MKEKRQQGRARRILIGLGPASNIDPSLTAATVLAAAIEAELVGLYAQDDAMIDLAALPFARALGIGAARPEPLTRDAMAKAIRQGAVTCRRVLSAHAERASVSWSFSTARGELSAIVRRTVADGDFLVLSADRIGFNPRQLIEELRSVPRDVGGILVAAPPRTKPSSGPVVAIDDGDASGRETIALASRIANISGAQLSLLVIAATDADAERIVRRANSLISSGQSMNAHRIAPGSPQAITVALAKLGPSFIVADKEGEPFENDETARSIFRGEGAPVLLVGSAKADEPG